MWWTRHEKQSFSGRTGKKMSRSWRISKSLVCRSWKSSTIEEWWTFYAGRKYIFSESVYCSDSGNARLDEFLEWCKRNRNCEQLWIMPHSQSTHEYSEAKRYDWPRLLLAACYTEIIRCTGHVFEGLLAPASASCIFRPIDVGRLAGRWEALGKEPQNGATTKPRFAKKFTTLNPRPHAEGTYPQNCLMEIPTHQISDLHFDTYLDTAGSQCWKTNLKIEVCSCSGCPIFAMLWVEEV